jgi:hypothetical protein
MLTRKHFVEFADFLVDEKIKLEERKANKIQELDKEYEQLTANIMLILDKNSLRFNKYQFKNYIISHVEKKQLNNTNKEHTIKLNIQESEVSNDVD